MRFFANTNFEIISLHSYFVDFALLCVYFSVRITTSVILVAGAIIAIVDILLRFLAFTYRLLKSLSHQGFKSASIVRLFDPVKSPRCYAIIATKE